MYGTMPFSIYGGDINLDGYLDIQNTQAVLNKCVKNGIPVTDKVQENAGCIKFSLGNGNIAPGETVSFNIETDKSVDYAEFVVVAEGITSCTCTNLNRLTAFNDINYNAALSNAQAGSILTLSFIVTDDAENISLGLIAGEGFEDIVSGNHVSYNVAA